MFGLSEVEFRNFIETISATAIANQAVLKCWTTGLPMTVDNVILFVGDFFDPADPRFDPLSLKILQAIVETVDDPKTRTNDNSPAGRRRFPLPC